MSLTQIPNRVGEAAAAISGVSTLTSFFVATLPVIQWLAAAVGFISGVVAIAWVVYQYRQRHVK